MIVRFLIYPIAIALICCDTDHTPGKTELNLGGVFVDITPTIACSGTEELWPGTGFFCEGGVVLGNGDPGCPARRYAYRNGYLVGGQDVPLGRLVGSIDVDGDGARDFAALDEGLTVAWSEDLSNRTRIGSLSKLKSVSFGDLDGDGDADILLPGDDLCGAESATRAFLNTSPRTYREQPSLVAEAPLTSCNILAILPGLRFATFGHDCKDEENPVVWRLNGSAFQAIPTRRLSTLNTPMGGALGDLDGDGILDMVATLDPNVLVLQGDAAGGYTPRYSAINSSNGLWPQIPWGTAILDIDLDGLQDIVVVNGNDRDAVTDPKHRPGPQHVIVLRNLGEFQFVDITASTGLDRVTGSFRALAVDDLDDDGDADLIVGGSGEGPRVWRNDTRPAGRRGLSIRVIPHTWNARVDVRIGSRSRTFYTGGIYSPNALSVPMTFLGMAESERATITVTAPAGKSMTRHSGAGSITVDLREGR